MVELLFIIVGGAGAGGGGVALLPWYSQTIGGSLSPRHAVELFRNVRYFDGNNIATPIAVLVGYGLVSLAHHRCDDQANSDCSRPHANQ